TPISTTRRTRPRKTGTEASRGRVGEVGGATTAGRAAPLAGCGSSRNGAMTTSAFASSSFASSRRMTEPLPMVRAWYDRLARIYDPLTDLAFRYRRNQAIQRLEVTEGLTVLEVACGTGLNFAAMEKRLGAAGTLIGVDYSEGMLERARRKIAKRGWQNVHLV